MLAYMLVPEEEALRPGVKVVPATRFHVGWDHTPAFARTEHGVCVRTKAGDDGLAYCAVAS